MAESIYLNSGRGCINCSGIWASRHTREIAEALAERLGPDRSAAADRSEGGPGRVHRARHGRRRVEADRAGPARRRASRTSTEKYGPRLVEQERASYLRPTIIHCAVARSAGRAKGIHVPVRDGRRVPAGGDAQANRPDAGRHGDHERRIVPRGGRRTPRTSTASTSARFPPPSSTGCSRTKEISSISCSATVRCKLAESLSASPPRGATPDSMLPFDFQLPDADRLRPGQDRRSLVASRRRAWREARAGRQRSGHRRGRAHAARDRLAQAMPDSTSQLFDGVGENPTTEHVDAGLAVAQGVSARR